MFVGSNGCKLEMIQSRKRSTHSYNKATADEICARTLETYNDIDDLMLPHQVDLSRFNDIQVPDLTNHIERVGRLFFERSTRN